MKSTAFMRQPSWQRPAGARRRTYTTTSGGDYDPIDVALRFALSLKIHNSADALRALALHLVPHVRLEQQPDMNLLARLKDDDKVFYAVLRIINRVSEVYQLAPGVLMERPS